MKPNPIQFALALTVALTAAAQAQYHTGHTSSSYTYTRPATPSYTRPTTPSYTRPTTPSYTRPATPSYTRPATPSYTRPATPTYTPPTTPTYTPNVRPPANTQQVGYLGYNNAPNYTRPTAPNYTSNVRPTTTLPNATQARPTVNVTYQQSTGSYNATGANGLRITGTGYSGAGTPGTGGRNNPNYEFIPNFGPIPQGSYTMTGCNNTLNGRPSPNVVQLQPAPTTQMYGRDNVRIHGNNATNNASTGCQIMPAADRARICELLRFGNGHLNVVP